MDLRIVTIVCGVALLVFGAPVTFGWVDLDLDLVFQDRGHTRTVGGRWIGGLVLLAGCSVLVKAYRIRDVPKDD